MGIWYTNNYKLTQQSCAFSLISNICVLISNICVGKRCFVVENTKVRTHKLLRSVHFKHLCVNLEHLCEKRCFAVENTRVRTHKLQKSAHFCYFEHLCEKTLFCSGNHAGENTQTSKECSFLLFRTSVCENVVLQ